MTDHAANASQARQFDTPTICNVIELFDVRPRNTATWTTAIRCDFPEMPPMVGFACTAPFRSDARRRAVTPMAASKSRSNGSPNLPGPAVVVFQDLDDPPVAATFGEVMCSTYKAFGSVGLITSAAAAIWSRCGPSTIRSSPASRSVRTPTATSCTWACRFASAGWWSTRAICLHGDANGVTNIPLDIGRGSRRRGRRVRGRRSDHTGLCKGSGHKDRDQVQRAASGVSIRGVQAHEAYRAGVTAARWPSKAVASANDGLGRPSYK